MTLVMPKMDIGRLRSLSPLHISVKVLVCCFLKTLLICQTCDSSSNDIDANRARTATEEASHDQRRKVRCRCGRDEPDLFKQNELVQLRLSTDSCSLHLRGTRCRRQSSRAYGLCSPSRARRAMGRPQRLRSTRPSPSTATGSYPGRFRIPLPSEHCRSRRRQQASQSRWSCGEVSGPKRCKWRTSSLYSHEARRDGEDPFA